MLLLFSVRVAVLSSVWERAVHSVYWACLSRALFHGDPSDMRESTSVFQIRTINRSKLDKRQVSMIDS